MPASWTPTSAFVPTTLCSFEFNVYKQHAQSPTFTYLACILDGEGKQKWALSGDISDYITEEQLEELENIIETLFEKAEDEMI